MTNLRFIDLPDIKIDSISKAFSLVDKDNNNIFLVLKHYWNSDIVTNITKDLDRPLAQAIRLTLKKKLNFYSVCGYYFRTMYGYESRVNPEVVSKDGLYYVYNTEMKAVSGFLTFRPNVLKLCEDIL